MPSEPNSSLRTRLRRNRLWVAAGGAVVAAAAVVGFWVFDTAPGNAVARPEKSAGEADGAFRPSDTQWSSLRLAPVRQVAFRDERATDGKIAINEDTTTPVFSPFSGRVSKLIARPGDLVERGAPLFAIEASEFVQGQNDLITAVAGVEKARSRLVLAQTAEKRQRELQAIRGGALKDLEQAQSDLVARRATCARPRSRSPPCATGCASSAARTRRSRSSRRPTASAPRPSCPRRSAARSSSAGSGLGQYINVGANDPVFTVGNLSTVWLIANVRESDAPKMKVGAAVEVTVLAFPGRVFNAKLAYVAPALDPNTRRLPVRAEIQNTGRELLPEMFASFRIVSGDDRLMPAVPVDAIVYEGAKARVWIARPDSKTVVSRDITVGDTINGLVEVRKGLSVGETVVTSGTLFIDRAARRD